MRAIPCLEAVEAVADHVPHGACGCLLLPLLASLRHLLSELLDGRFVRVFIGVALRWVHPQLLHLRQLIHLIPDLLPARRINRMLRSGGLWCCHMSSMLRTGGLWCTDHSLGSCLIADIKHYMKQSCSLLC